MMPTNGRGLVEDRWKPQIAPEVARYLRWEYGPGTEPAYLLAELERSRRASHRRHRRSVRAVLNAFAEALKAFVVSHVRRSTGSEEVGSWRRAHT